MFQGTLLCNNVYHFSTASVGAPCTSPGLRKLFLDPKKTILPNNKTELSAWYAKMYMGCAATIDSDGQPTGCYCNITSQITNALGGWTSGPGGGATNLHGNSFPNGLDLGIGYSPSLTIQDFVNYYAIYPHKGICYLPPVAPPRPGCSPTWNYTGLNG